ncbi:uncharacterized protein LOC132292367 isoform X2 [Cornus florida]|uniref:uncharacterized protein LOC132292367 isoform X2 n=1 Tax=Cornus florida TaxID=4283 RepID=UPI00289EF00C|nr:uncharacterized protein LOC132292367 isoform X2 [Cornus florida]
MNLQSPPHRHETLTFRTNFSSKKPIPTSIQCCVVKRDLEGQSVAVIGLGKSGIAAARLAVARGASVLAVDHDENLGLLEQNPMFEKHSSLKTILGNFDNELLKDADTVVVSPGIPLGNYGLSSLLQSGKNVMSELDFAAEVLPRCTKILAVTGTNGKSTVATFAGQMLNYLHIKTFIGGNLGIPLSEAAFQCLTSSLEKPMFQVAVVEVSSYQLEIPNKHFCPSVALILNLTPDHLERHKTMKNYAMIKCRIFSRMCDSKMCVLPLGNQHLNEAVRDRMNKFNPAWIGDFPGVKIDLEAKTASFEIPNIEGVSQLQLDAMKTIGTHNYYNAAVAALSVIGLDIGIDTEAINSTIGKLRVPPHRMQIVRKDTLGVTWVDDSKATNVEAAYTGLLSLREQKSVVLLGGLAKFGSSGTMIQKILSANGLSIPCVGATNLEDAVKRARNMTRYGDAIVLCPGCASFDEFRNFEHRGKIFQELAFSF